MRFNELIAGVRADVAIKLYGDDLDAMSEQAKRIAAVCAPSPALATSAPSRRPARRPSTCRSTVRRRALRPVGRGGGEHRLGRARRSRGRVAVRGRPAVLVVVRLPDAQRDDLETLGSIPVMLPAAEGQVARSIPLQVARFSYTQG
jgi:cobalt-zinc-cadmium resistance protein CzcA